MAIKMMSSGAVWILTLFLSARQRVEAVRDRSVFSLARDSRASRDYFLRRLPGAVRVQKGGAGLPGCTLGLMIDKITSAPISAYV